MTPVVFIHYGPIADYVKFALKKAGEKNSVVLITDQTLQMDKIEVVQASTISGGIDTFSGVYRHLSKNPEEFELRCFTRWGLLLNLMALKGYDRVFYCDSDVMLFSRIDDALSPEMNIAYSIPEHQPEFRWSASAHVSCFSFEKLNSLWEFMVRTYTDKTEMFFQLKSKYKNHLSKGLPGGVCDMTLFHFFSQQNDVTPLCRVQDGSTFDHNINSSENSIKDEYEMRQVSTPHGPITIKTVRMENGNPMCMNLDLDQEIRFHSLHFQGGAKILMPHFA